jgi:cellulose synthase operon protein C
VRPEYPNQVLVSYYQAGKICDYMAAQWGDAAILGMIHSYAARQTTAEAIQPNFHESAGSFDKNFATWLDSKTGNTVRHFDEWEKGMKAAHADLRDGKKDDALRKGLAIRNYYPDYVGAGSDYDLLSNVYLSSGRKAEAADELSRYRDLGGTDIAALKKLAQLEQESSKPKEAISTLEKLNFIYPEDEDVHRKLGDLLLKDGQTDPAIREFRAVLALKPADAAESHFDLARALNAAHQSTEAKDQVLTALEAAPDFKPAQQLLLQLSQ